MAPLWSLLLATCCLFASQTAGKPQFMHFEAGPMAGDDGPSFAIPEVGFSLRGMDDRLKSAPAGLDRMGAGLNAMFDSSPDPAPFDTADVKTTIKNETKGNMKITTIDKKGKNFHMVQKVSEMKPSGDNQTMMGGREETMTMTGGSSSGGDMSDMAGMGGMMSGGFGGMGADMGGPMGGFGGGFGALGGLGSLFGSILGGGLMGAGNKKKQKKKKDLECSPEKECPAGKFCDPASGECKKLLAEGATCVMKGQCDPMRQLLCTWGKCNKAKQGDAGTFCKKNKDCLGDSDMSCNMRTEISKYFAVCSPRLDVGSVCGRTNPMASLFGGGEPDADANDDGDDDDDDGSGPCKKGLKCANVGTYGSKICVSKDVKLKTLEEEEKEKEEKNKAKAEKEKEDQKAKGEKEKVEEKAKEAKKGKRESKGKKGKKSKGGKKNKE